MIPALNDHEMEQGAGARWRPAHGGELHVLRLPLRIKDLFTEWLERMCRARAQHVLDLIRDVRGGELYDFTWANACRAEVPMRRSCFSASGWPGSASASTPTSEVDLDLSLVQAPDAGGGSADAVVSASKPRALDDSQDAIGSATRPRGRVAGVRFMRCLADE